MNAEAFGKLAIELAYFAADDPHGWAPVRPGLYLRLTCRWLGCEPDTALRVPRIATGRHLLAACERDGYVELRRSYEGDLQFRRRGWEQYSAPRTTVLAPLVRGEDR